ncbi:uncharacterized protein LOC127867485 [Dreissena polymorpha]|uniref:LRAT domain-containing protein n=1 Tax=Dreissena polymorpha TaxID=45954 RepID=A0A9D4M2I8_DREPO|nr:uncharacterized protein LOC127867485 [Dreissena polymorpha]XP_052264618.1 uncharacterized protein LOC127867485 [Dreissena polymorpha]KAH3867266.1 hypothetical protein DPMN_030392 [Dreissena polymorpha]
MYRQLSTRNNRYFKEESDEETDNKFEETNENTGVFQTNPNITKLGQDKFKILKPGDHITCHRSYIIYHHAIVVDVDQVGNRLQVIHYTTVKGKRKKAEIKKEWLDSDKLGGDWYRINYSKNVADKNKTELVLDRAHSRLGETDYKILKNNCESFASYCKTGVSDCFQTKWLNRKVTEVSLVNNNRVCNEIVKIVGDEVATQITSNITEDVIKKSTAKMVLAESIERVGNASNFVGAGLVVGLETCLMARDISEMYEKRKEGKMSRKVFTGMATQRATEAVGASVCTVGLGLGLEVFGGFIGGLIGSVVPVIGTAFGGAIGSFIGSILGGVFGSLLGRAGGSFFGNMIAKTTTKFIRDDIAVNSIDDIHSGDHIIVYASFFHRRCHAIAVNVQKPNTVRVIRNKFRRGVVDETVEFKKPVYKALYTEGATHSPDVVVTRAKSKIGQNEYSFFTNDCKDFARWCKEKK